MSTWLHYEFSLQTAILEVQLMRCCGVQLISETTNTCLRERLLFEVPSLMLSQAVTLADQYEQAVSQANEFCNDTSIHHVKERKSFLQSSERTDEHACCEKRRAKAYDHLLEYALNFRACYRCGPSCKQPCMSGM